MLDIELRLNLYCLVNSIQVSWKNDQGRLLHHQRASACAWEEAIDPRKKLPLRTKISLWQAVKVVHTARLTASRRILSSGFEDTSMLVEDSSRVRFAGMDIEILGDSW